MSSSSAAAAAALFFQVTIPLILCLLIHSPERARFLALVSWTPIDCFDFRLIIDYVAGVRSFRLGRIPFQLVGSGVPSFLLFVFLFSTKDFIPARLFRVKCTRALPLMDCSPSICDKKSLKKWFFIDKTVG
ncbi:hypothetical protein LINPERHAP1_LOCUS5597 [Linum perenne]